jgi:hypothetical protein
MQPPIESSLGQFPLPAIVGLKGQTVKDLKRRLAIKHAGMLAFGMCLGKMDSLKAAGGQLTVNLDQWSHVTFSHKGKTVVVSVAEIFEALQ